jgi:YD repeat-containing protein
LTDFSFNANYDKEKTIKYDSKSNPIEITKYKNITTSFLWGYNKTLPIAMVKNASYYDIKSILGHDQLNLLTNSILPDKQIRDKLSILRDELSNAQVTIYTYEPLEGITSKTDPSGKTTYYQYDNYGRLKSIRDNRNKLIKMFDYHYEE